MFRNRKGAISQNVLAVANFDLTFSYALAGWEGSAHDGKVLKDAICKGMPALNDRYYLADAGYALSKLCLTPYRGVRYHLKEWAKCNARPQSKEELFNLRHSSLRNVIERLFGVVKKRFPILVNMHSYPFQFQIALVLSCFMIHNFIRMNQGYDDEFDAWSDVDDEAGDDPEEPIAGIDEEQAITAGAGFRHDIAQHMWNDYQAELGDRAAAAAHQRHK